MVIGWRGDLMKKRRGNMYVEKKDGYNKQGIWFAKSKFFFFFSFFFFFMGFGQTGDLIWYEKNCGNMKNYINRNGY